MRLIKVVVSKEQREDVTDIFDSEDIDYISQEVRWNGEQRWLIEAPLPTDAIEYVLKQLRDEDVDPGEYTTITSLESATTPGSEQLLDRFAGDFDPLTQPELRSKARDLSRDPRSFLAMTLLSAAIAVAGLLAGSPAIVVGSMVIASLVGPVLTTAVGGVTGDRRMVFDSIWLQCAGIAIAVLGAAIVSYLLQGFGFCPSTLDVMSIDLIALRTGPNTVSVLVGVASGIATVFGLTTKGPTSVIGVLITAALVPAAAVTGIATAWGDSDVVVGSLVLLLITLVVISVSATVSLQFFGSDAEGDDSGLMPSGSWWEVAITVVFIVLLPGIVGLATVEQTTFERTATQEVTDTLEDDAFAHLSLESVRVHYAVPVVDSSRTAIVVASQPNQSREPQKLATVLAARLSDAVGEEVVVRVQYRTC